MNINGISSRSLLLDELITSVYKLLVKNSGRFMYNENVGPRAEGNITNPVSAFYLLLSFKGREQHFQV